MTTSEAGVPRVPAGNSAPTGNLAVVEESRLSRRGGLAARVDLTGRWAKKIDGMGKSGLAIPVDDQACP